MVHRRVHRFPKERKRAHGRVGKHYCVFGLVPTVTSHDDFPRVAVGFRGIPQDPTGKRGTEMGCPTGTPVISRHPAGYRGQSHCFFPRNPAGKPHGIPWNAVRNRGNPWDLSGSHVNRAVYRDIYHEAPWDVPWEPCTDHNRCNVCRYRISQTRPPRTPCLPPPRT